MKALRPVSWGSGPLALLLPQRRPFLMLDRITGFALGPSPTLTGSRYITANEPVFDGHFPEAPVWPGVLTIEGLAQASAALVALLDRAGECDLERLVEGLDLVEASTTLSPGRDAERERAFRTWFSERRGGTPGVFGGAEVKLVEPVFPGCRLDYRVVLGRRLGDLIRLEGEATVEHRLVASGRWSGSRR